MRPAFPKPKDMPRRKRVDHVETMLDGREVCDLRTRAGVREYKIRTLLMWHRQDGMCPRCKRRIAEEDASFDHVVPRGHGGAMRDDRIEIKVPVRWDEEGNVLEEVTIWQNECLHLWCNILKGSRREVREDANLRQSEIFTESITVDTFLDANETASSEAVREAEDDDEEAGSSSCDGSRTDDDGGMREDCDRAGDASSATDSGGAERLRPEQLPDAGDDSRVRG